jgi:hypothetical protein
MVISVTSQGDFNQTKIDLQNLLNDDINDKLDGWGQMGVEALSNATPEDTGLTADSWAYRVTQNSYGPIIEWYNTNTDDQGTQIAIMIQYGHGTGTGGYVPGQDYINPAIQEVFDNIINEIGK